MQTKFFCAGESSKAKVLVIGHDPRLREADTQADFAFFADYYFKPIPTQRGELAKYRLAEAVFDYIGHLTNHQYTADQLILTNLCNQGLPHAAKGRTVYIPKEEARVGIDAIQGILNRSSVENIFAMSVQVNYWLQELGFYSRVPVFLERAQPKAKGIENKSPYYEPKQNGAFRLICGESFANGKWRLFPVLHVKNWPLVKGFAKVYSRGYQKCINELKPKCV